MIIAQEVVNSAIPDRVSCQAPEGELREMEQSKKLKHDTRISQIKNDSDKVKVKTMTRYTICTLFAYVYKKKKKGSTW